MFDLDLLIYLDDIYDVRGRNYYILCLLRLHRLRTPFLLRANLGLVTMTYTVSDGIVKGVSDVIVEGVSDVIVISDVVKGVSDVIVEGLVTL